MGRLAHEIKMLDPEKNGLHIVTDDEQIQIHSILLEMLDDIKRVCDMHDIKWGISGGCALGAIRHKGFIPWDDDVDIVFPRQEFEKFRKVYPKEKKSQYEFLCPGDEKYYIHLPRIFDTNTTAELIQRLERGKGLFIDIFILENTYDNKLLRFIHGLECTAYLFIISCVITRSQREVLMKYGSAGLRKQAGLRSLFGGFFTYRTAEKWLQKAITCFSKVKDEKSEYVVSVTGGGHYFGEIYKREKMCNYEERVFEDKRYPFMEDIPYFCNMRYGSDYMRIPPEEKREKHVYVKLDLEK